MYIYTEQGYLSKITEFIVDQITMSAIFASYFFELTAFILTKPVA